MFLFFLTGCFSPVSGQWAFHDVDVLGDCALDQATSLDQFVTITDSDSGFSLQRVEDSFSCSLDGMDFSCLASQRDVDAEEVQLSVALQAEGTFDDRASGQLLILETWSCVSGACDTYGLETCTASFEGVLALSNAE